MTHKVYIVTDLGPGDGGKGGVVHAIAKAQRAHTVIKRGGAQGSHGVRTSIGEAFAFSQWGCGTFDGIPTHISEQMIVSPEGLLNEADQLRVQFGIYDPFKMLTVDSRALVATPLHGVASRLLELYRGANPRGTVGTGVGQAYRDSLRYPELAITTGDLAMPDLRDRLYAVRDTIREYLMVACRTANFLDSDEIAFQKEYSVLHDDGFVEYIYRRFREVSQVATIVDPSYLKNTILAKPGVAVVETSHGVLTDRVYGFTPHTSAIRTLPRFTRQIFDDAGYTGSVVNLGISRAYAIRHGAGPLPTHDPALSEQLLPGSHKQDNRWQGSVRVGALDGVLLRYAINVCGGPSVFDGLAITWFDQILQNGNWLTCNSYANCDDDSVFTHDSELIVTHGTPSDLHERQTTALQTAVPNITSQVIDATLSKDSQYDVCAQRVQELTGVPVRMVSIGPTELDKLTK